MKFDVNLLENEHLFESLSDGSLVLARREKVGFIFKRYKYFLDNYTQINEDAFKKIDLKPNDVLIIKSSFGYTKYLRLIVTNDYIYRLEDIESHENYGLDFVIFNWMNEIKEIRRFFLDSSATRIDWLKQEKRYDIVYKKKEIREMKVSEIEKRLGHKVKIIKE